MKKAILTLVVVVGGRYSSGGVVRRVVVVVRVVVVGRRVVCKDTVSLSFILQNVFIDLALTVVGRWVVVVRTRSGMVND